MEKKVKKDLELYSDDIYYDLFMNSNLDPDKILEDKKDIEKVNKAMEIVQEYIKILEDVVEEM